MYEGIDCNQDNKIVNITLNNMNLHGLIPSNLGRLAHLRILDLKHNRLSGTVPSDLRFAPLEHFDVGNNSVMGPLPPLLCQQDGINANGEKGLFSCDILACPISSWHPSGKALQHGRHCFPCQNARYLGQIECNTDGLSKAEGLSEYVESHRWPHAAFIFIMASVLVLAFMAHHMKRRKRELGEQNAKMSQEQYYEDNMFGGSAYHADYGVHEELSVMSANKRQRQQMRNTSSGAKQRTSARPTGAVSSGIVHHQTTGSAVSQTGSRAGRSSAGGARPATSAASQQQVSATPSATRQMDESQNSNASPGDDPDTQDLWLDVPKIA